MSEFNPFPLVIIGFSGCLGYLIGQDVYSTIVGITITTSIVILGTIFDL